MFRCNQCGRTHGKKEFESEDVSSQDCVKCYAAFYKEDMDDLKEILKGIIKREEACDLVWEGEEREYNDEELAVYNEVLAELRRENSGELKR